MLRNAFLYGTPGNIKNCLTCERPTFFYSAYGLTWSYCSLCQIFYTPNRQREISRFLVTVAEALEVKNGARRHR